MGSIGTTTIAIGPIVLPSQATRQLHERVAPSTLAQAIFLATANPILAQLLQPESHNVWCT